MPALIGDKRLYHHFGPLMDCLQAMADNYVRDDGKFILTITILKPPILTSYFTMWFQVYVLCIVKRETLFLGSLFEYLLEQGLVDLNHFLLSELSFVIFRIGIWFNYSLQQSSTWMDLMIGGLHIGTPLYSVFFAFGITKSTGWHWFVILGQAAAIGVGGILWHVH